MLSTIFGIALLVFYLYFGYTSIDYIKANIMGIKAEIYNDNINYYGQKLCMAALFGWAAIPIAFIHKNFIAK